MPELFRLIDEKFSKVDKEYQAKKEKEAKQARGRESQNILIYWGWGSNNFDWDLVDGSYAKKEEI